MLWRRGRFSRLLAVPSADGCSLDNHDIISMKLFQLMVEHPLEDETVDWTKIEPSVSLLKSPKGEALLLPRPLLEDWGVPITFLSLQTTWMIRRGISEAGP